MSTPRICLISLSASSTIVASSGQKIHLQQAEFFQPLHVVLGDNSSLFVLLERDQILQRLRRYHDAGRVHAAVRAMPSSRSATSSISRTRGSFAAAALIAGSCASASAA